MDNAAREELLRKKLQDIARDAFPDDDVEWRVIAIRHHGAYAFVEAEARPPTVGYPAFIFVQHFDAVGMRDCGCYAKMKDGWKILCTTPGAPGDWKNIPPASI